MSMYVRFKARICFPVLLSQLSWLQDRWMEIENKEPPWASAKAALTVTVETFLSHNQTWPTRARFGKQTVCPDSWRWGLGFSDK